MTRSDDRVVRVLDISRRREHVWEALTDKSLLEQWLHPNDFEPRLGHQFHFRLPPRPEVGFPGMVVRSEVLAFDPPWLLVLAWNAEPPVSQTRVTFRLEPLGENGESTRMHFEHAGFDLDHPIGTRARQGAEFGWKAMVDRFVALLGAEDGIRHDERFAPESPTHEGDRP